MNVIIIRYLFKYYVGQLVVCRQSFKVKKSKLYTNYKYEIVKFSPDDKNECIISLKNVYNDDNVDIKYDQLKYISLPYSSTCHI